MQLEQFTLPTFWACALINGDMSGMSDEDEAAMDCWFDQVLETYEMMHCVSVDDNEGGDFRRYHDASEFVLACDVSTFTFQTA
jgi:hypothetical protein